MAQQIFRLRSQDPAPVEKPVLDPNYPAIRYHRSGKSHRIFSAEQEPQGEGWAAKPWPPLPAAEPEDTLESLKVKFDAAYGKLLAENTALRTELETLKKKKKA